MSLCRDWMSCPGGKACLFRQARQPESVGPERKEPNWSYRLLRAIYPVFRILFPNQVIRADDLARVMVDAAVGGIPEDRFSPTASWTRGRSSRVDDPVLPRGRAR